MRHIANIVYAKWKNILLFFHKLVRFIIFLPGKIQTGVELIDPGLYPTGILFSSKKSTLLTVLLGNDFAEIGDLTCEDADPSQQSQPIIPNPDILRHNHDGCKKCINWRCQISNHL